MNSFGGKGAPGSITVQGGTVRRTVSFGAAVYAHGVDDPQISFKDVTFDHVATVPGLFESKLNFSNGPLAIAALGNKLGGHALGGVRFENVIVKEPIGVERPLLVVVGSGDGSVAKVRGSITLHTSSQQQQGCAGVPGGGGGGGGQGLIVAGAEGWSSSMTKSTEQALRTNVSIHCEPPESSQ